MLLSRTFPIFFISGKMKTKHSLFDESESDEDVAESGKLLEINQCLYLSRRYRTYLPIQVRYRYRTWTCSYYSGTYLGRYRYLLQDSHCKIFILLGTGRYPYVVPTLRYLYILVPYGTVPSHVIWKAY